MMAEYTEHRCDFCSGTVSSLVARDEPMRVCGKVVLLDGQVIGKCQRCGHRYYPAAVVKLAERIATHPEEATRHETIPVAAA